MKTLSILLPLTLTLFFSSCQPEPLEVKDLPDPDPGVVVSSVHLYGDAQIIFMMSRNLSAIAGNIENDRDALIPYMATGGEAVLHVRDEKYELYEYLPGLYAGHSGIPRYFGEQYLMTFEDRKTGHSVYANTMLTRNIEFTDVQVHMDYTSLDSLPKVSFRFRDFIGTNWYMINVQHKSDFSRSFAGLVNSRYFTHLFSDEDIRDGDVIIGEFTALIDNIKAGDTLTVALSNIPRKYYEFMEKANNGLEAPNLISEPYNYPTNVVGGYGFFDMSFPDRHDLIVQPDKR